MIIDLNTRDAIIWAAGFIDADGWCGTEGGSLIISVSQVEMYPIVMLNIYFGGNIIYVQRKEPKNANGIYVWRLYGIPAIELMMSMYIVLSSHKRKAQVRKCIKQFKKGKSCLKGYCHKGHKISGNNVRHGWNGKRECKICYTNRYKHRSKKIQQERKQRIKNFIALTATGGSLERR